MVTRIAYQGAPGAFGEAAALLLWPGAVPIGVMSFDAVVASIQSGQAEGGVLPIDNRIVGPVEEAIAALESTDQLEVIGTVAIPVRLHLLGCGNASVASVGRIAGHPVALAQCRRFLNGLRGVVVEEWFDSAGASRVVRELADPTFAAVAGDAAAARYDLTILERDIHDHPDNETTFVGVRRQR